MTEHIAICVLISLWPGSMIFAYGYGWRKGFRKARQMGRDHQALMDAIAPRFRP